MRPWFRNSPLFSPDSSPGGSDTALVDLGAPFEHGDDPAPAEKKPEKSAEQIEIENLRAENAASKRRADEAEETARYWANRGRQQPEREVRREPEPERREAVVTEKPEKLLDDLTSEGLEALKKRGVVTGPELAQILEEQEQRMEGRMQAVRQDAEFGARIAQEFPEIAEDSKRIDRGEKPKSDLFMAASRIYQQLVADDPALKDTNGALLIAARQAKAEVAAKSKNKDEPMRGENNSSQDTRRARIDRQRGDRVPAGSEGDEGHQDGFSKQQLEVMKHLKVKPEDFRKHAGVTKNGR